MLYMNALYIQIVFKGEAKYEVCYCRFEKIR